MTVVVLGASPKPGRYANMAIRLLREHGHDVIPVNPAYETIENLAVVAALSDVEPETVDTITVYVNADRSAKLQEAMLGLRPRRVIFNPGSENRELQKTLQEAGIQVEEACSLVLLRTGAF